MIFCNTVLMIEEGAPGTRIQVNNTHVVALNQRKDILFARGDSRGIQVLHGDLRNGSPPTWTLAGGAIFTIISAVAQLERDIITERVKAGLRRARENGKKLGRPKACVDRQKVQLLHSQGASHRSIAEQLGISHSTVGQILRNHP